MQKIGENDHILLSISRNSMELSWSYIIMSIYYILYIISKISASAYFSHCMLRMRMQMRMSNFCGCSAEAESEADVTYIISTNSMGAVDLEIFLCFFSIQKIITRSIFVVDKNLFKISLLNFIFYLKILKKYGVPTKMKAVNFSKSFSLYKIKNFKRP